MMLVWDVTDLRRLSAELGRTPLRLAGLAPAALMEAGTELQDKWRSNATITAGVHGKHYPKSIKAKPAGQFAVDVGPTPGMKQAGMSFEFGSRNQPPHLDGQRALDAVAPTLALKVQVLMAKALGG